MWEGSVWVQKVLFERSLRVRALRRPEAKLGTREGYCQVQGLRPTALGTGGQTPTADTPLTPAGIIDLSQVPHLPVLVPPTPGTPATAIDRLAYLPTAPPPFSSRHSNSPLSPGASGNWVVGFVPHSGFPEGKFCPIGSGSHFCPGVSRRPHSPS